MLSYCVYAIFYYFANFYLWILPILHYLYELKRPAVYSIFYDLYIKRYLECWEVNGGFLLIYGFEFLGPRYEFNIKDLLGKFVDI